LKRDIKRAQIMEFGIQNCDYELPVVC
jgi:hypothetical protein